MGHEVFIFAPAPGLSTKTGTEEDHIIRFPALSGLVYEENNLSLIFPPKTLGSVRELELDLFHFLTPGPVGLFAVYAANKLNKPLVAEYCTDLYQYSERYPGALPAIAALGASLPFTFKMTREEFWEVLKAGRPRLGGFGKWNSEMVKSTLNVVHSHCDGVIAHSRKSEEQLQSWQNGDHYPIHLIPTGIDPAPEPTAKQLASLRKKWRIKPDDEVVLYLGRVSVEKNLDLLVGTMEELIKWRPNAKLVIVGDFDYRPTLEAHAKASTAADRIVFVGKIPHEEIGWAYAVAEVFAFPSLTDTQSLTLHEATLAGLPVVMIDHKVTEVVKDGVNGYFCNDDPIDMAAKLHKILEDPTLRKKMSAQSKKIAKQFSEKAQCSKIMDLYNQIIDKRAAVL
jgi:glycosyltransferase involved in cell wall biosynthesis